MSAGRRSIIFSALCPLLFSAFLSAQTKPTTDDQACGVFTRAGLSLLATIQGPHVSLTLGDSPQPFLLSLPAAAGQVATRASGNNTCVLALNASEDEAAIGIPLAAEADSALAPALVARFNLTRRSWSAPVLVTPPPPLASLLHGRYRTSLRLLGYRQASPDLILAGTDQQLIALTPNGQQSPAPANLEPSLLETPSSLSLAQSRFWSSCDQPPIHFVKAVPCSFFATTLFGNRQVIAKVLSPLVRPEPHVAPWAKPDFYADLGQTLVFAGYEMSGLEPAYAVWVANLNDGAIHQIAVPARFNDAAVTGQFAVSTDGDVLAFAVNRSRLDPSRTDDYVSLGDRIVVIDLRAHKLQTEIRPIDRRSSLALAIHHTGDKTTLLVNWGNGWQPQDLSSQAPDLRRR